MSSESLNIQVLADHSRDPRIGTRLTYMPRDLLSECSFDSAEKLDGEAK